MFPHQRYQFQPTQCPNTGTQHRPTGNGSTSGLTSPQCQTSVHHYFSQEGFSFCCLLLFSLGGSPKPAMAVLLTSHRLIALTFMHRAGSLVPWDSQIHNNSSDCPRLPAPSNNHLFPWPHLQRPTSSSLSPSPVYLHSGNLVCLSLALTLTCTTPPAPVTDTTNTWLCTQVWLQLLALKPPYMHMLTKHRAPHRGK